MPMIGVLGEVLPYALGVALSPIPVIATILLLMSPRPRQLGVGFMGGWLVGVLVPVVVFTLLSEVLPDRDQDATDQPIRGVIQLVLGSALIALAVRRWRSRPKAGEEPRLPKWMSSIDSMTLTGAVRLAVLLAAVNPKNLLMLAAAGSAIGYSLDGPGEIAGTIAAVTIIATVTIGVPVVAYLIAPEKAAAALDGLRTWLTVNSAVIMSVLMLVLGVQVLGKSFSSFGG
jgi:threonine/homoserine/homoserine lactone efflux protein